MSNPEDRYQPGDQATNQAGFPAGGQEPPQYGQRSENWSPNQPPAAQPAPDPSRPWPVYDPASGASQPNPAAGQAWGQPPVPPVPPAGGPAYSAGYGYPPAPPTGSPLGVKLPSRAGAIWTMVLGGILAVIVAPAVFIGFVMGGLDWNSLVSGSSSVTNQSEVTVDDSGIIALVSQGSPELSSCTLTSGSQTYELYEESGSGMVVGRNIPAGTYTVDCGVPQGTSLFVLRGDDLSGVVGATQTGLIWASIIGLVGVVAFIVGIVWLVQRNRQRREALRGQWGGVPGPYGR